MTRSPHTIKTKAAALWRIVAVAALPIAVWSYVNLYEYTPQSAGGISYEVVTNRITGEHCIEYEKTPTRPTLIALACNP